MDKRFAHVIYEFENFRLDAGQRMLSRDGEDIALPPKAVETLLVLVERRGRIVSKDDLLEAVWKDVIVEESNLYGYLHTLRNTLGDQENGKPFVETLRRRGYRFNGEVHIVDQDADLSSDQVATISPLSTVHQNSKRRKLIVAALCAFMVVALATPGFFYFKTEAPLSETSHAASEQSTNNADIYRLCIQGLDLAQRLTPNEYKRALDQFEQAKAIDPNHPMPYIGIATANRVNMLSADAPPANRMPEAREAALKAIQLSPNNGDAHTALGMITFFYDWDWAKAEEQLRRGYELSPNSVDTNIQLAHFYSNMGRHTDALQLSKGAVDLDPASPRIGALRGMILFYAGHHDESIEYLTTVIEFRPEFWLSYLNRQRGYLEKGLSVEALNDGELAVKNSSPSLEIYAQRAYAYAISGEIDKSRQALDELEKIAEDGRYVGPYLFAIIHNSLGDTKKALSLLEEAYQVHDWRMAFLKVDPRLNNLRSELRFVELMQKMQFK